MCRCLQLGVPVVVVLLCALLVGGCRSGQKAETLDRETALSLLREEGSAAGRVPSRPMDLVVFETGPPETARLNFLKGLEPNLLKLVSTSVVPAPGFSAIPSEKRPPVKRYEFAPADPKLAAGEMNDDTMKQVSFPIADAGYTEVSGIVQEGSRAVATVEASFAPNATYHVLEAAIAKAGSSPGFVLVPLPAEADLRKSRKLHVGFQRYDDGWRLAPRLF